MNAIDKPPPLAIVVVAYKSADSTANTLDHLEDAVADINAEILVIDNASGDGSRSQFETAVARATRERVRSAIAVTVPT